MPLSVILLFLIVDIQGMLLRLGAQIPLLNHDRAHIHHNCLCRIANPYNKTERIN